MKKAKLFGLALVAGIMLASCASFATVQDVPQKTIPILGFVPGKNTPQGTVIASFNKIFGICLKYNDFVSAVQGKNYDVMEKRYFVFSKVFAVAK
jgi:ABC-type glycerol-3-phosphate transport system substrate-binding protein